MRAGVFLVGCNGFLFSVGQIAQIETDETSLREQAARLREKKRKGKTVNIKIRFHDFTTIVRSKTLPESVPINCAKIISFSFFLSL